jgi:hypothetical protein
MQSIDTEPVVLPAPARLISERIGRVREIVRCSSRIPSKFSEITVAGSDTDRASCKFPMNVYIFIIDIWPDNRAVLLLALPGARSDSLSKTSTNRVEVARSRASIHVHLHQSRKAIP